MWNLKKQKINQKKSNLNPKTREIWWCSFGLNVGREIYGKGEDFLRPVLVINTEMDSMFIGIPLTSKLYSDLHKKIIITDDNKKHGILFYQIKSFDRRRLVKKMYTISKNKYKKIFKNFVKIYEK
jgi:mRNA interferase MazF